MPRDIKEALKRLLSTVADMKEDMENGIDNPGRAYEAVTESMAILGPAISTFLAYHSAEEEAAAGCEIRAYAHCVQCMREKPQNVSPAEWARLSVGATPVGVQVWCVRHNVNVAHWDFGSS